MISVIVPIYNVEDYVDKCINSLLNQSDSDYEIILVNDGSTDSSADIMDKYNSVYNIKIIHQENSGVSVARNVGINESTGDWITFVDGDDFVEPNFISSLQRIITNNYCDMVVFNYKAFFNEDNVFNCRMLPYSRNRYISEEKSFYQKRMISQYYLGGDRKTIVSSGTTWCKLIKKDIIVNNSIKFKPGLIRAQDTVFWLNATEKVDEIFFLNENLYNYRLSNNSISSGKKYLSDSVEKFNILIKEYRRFIEDNNKDNTYLDALNLRYIQVIMWNIDHNFFNKKNNHKLHSKIKQLNDFIDKIDYQNAIRNVSCGDLPTRLKIMLKYVRNRRLYEYYYIFKLYNFLSSIKNRRI